MSAFQIVFALAAFGGHCALWVTLFNRANAGGRQWLHVGEKTIVAGLATPLILIGLNLLQQRTPTDWGSPAGLHLYGWFCLAVLTWTLPPWIVLRIGRRRTPAALVQQTVRNVAVQAQLEVTLLRGSGKLWGCFPGNESCDLCIEKKTLGVPGMPASMAPLTVTQISDLHFTGRIALEYFAYVVDEANALQSDLILVTGDIVDRHKCLPWLKSLLGRLEADLGVHFVLGNHDRRLGENRIRGELAEAGLLDLGGCSRLVTIGGRNVLLAGDERPWFNAEPQMPDWSAADLKLLAAHTPDRFRWAQNTGFDVVFAGHTHGGQVRLPFIGPILSPSIYGTRYASGVFDEQGTIMHVSRGVSGLQPLRWLCPPEITQLTLAPVAAAASGE